MAIPRGDHTVVHALRRAVQAHPNRPWIVTDDGRATYADVDLLSNRIANGLLGLGLMAADAVLVLMVDSIDYIALWVALSKIGAIEIPINVNYRGDILRHVINDSRAGFIVVGSELSGRVVDLAGDLPRLRSAIIHGGLPVGEMEGVAAVPFHAIVAGDHPIGHEPNGRDLMSVMYTSGTTGPSKGVTICHAHAYCYATATVELLDIVPSDVYFAAGLPMFHVAGKWGVFLATAIVGCTAAMPGRFSASRFWEVVDRFGGTKAFLLGVMGNLLQRQPPAVDDRKHSLKKVVMAPLLADAKTFVERFDIHLCTAFGATEFNTPILLHNADDAPDAACVGRVRSDLFEVRILDDNDDEVGPNELGELVVRSKFPWLITPGYWHQPEATLKAWRNLWFHTGDLGKYDEQGLFYFVDRKKDAIRRRGENISSMEVEGIVCQHRAVQECAVYPVASEFTEQEVMVAIVSKHDAIVDPVDLMRFLEAKMPYFMVPRYVDFVTSLPKTPSGKITKVDLRTRGLTPTTWDRETAGLKLNR